MVSPQHNDRILGVFAALQSLQNPPNLCIDKTDRRQISLNSSLPLSAGVDIGVVTTGCRKILFSRRIINFPGKLPPKSWNVRQVAGLERWKRDTFKWIRLEILFRDNPW